MITTSEQLLSSITYTADGSQKAFAVPFDYLRTSFVKVKLNNIATSDYEVLNREVVFVTAPVAQTLIEIYRVTPTTPLVSWADASIMKALDMNVSQVQQLHIIEEGQDWSKLNSVVLEDDVYNMRFHRVINVADPVDDQDAVTKKYMESVQGGFVSENKKLVAEATKQVDLATEQANKASTKAVEASASASNAKNSEANAQKWAESSESPDGKEDVDSPTGKTQSAKGWADTAKNIAESMGQRIQFFTTFEQLSLDRTCTWEQIYDALPNSSILLIAANPLEESLIYTPNLKLPFLGSLYIQKSSGVPYVLQINLTPGNFNAGNNTVYALYDKNTATLSEWKTLIDGKDLNIKTFTSLEQIGIEKGTETKTEISKMLPDSSQISYYVHPNSGYNTNGVYPTAYGMFMAKRQNDVVSFEFQSYAGPPSTETIENSLYICGLFSNNEAPTEWQKILKASEMSSWTVQKGNNGWARESNTGFTIQWGCSEAGGTLNYPRTFKEVFNVIPVSHYEGTNENWGFSDGYIGFTTTSFKFANRYGGPCRWVALGIT